MSLSYRSTGNAKPWQVAPRPLDASLRLQMHGKIRPMSEPSWLARLFRVGRR